MNIDQCLDFFIFFLFLASTPWVSSIYLFTYIVMPFSLYYNLDVILDVG